MVATGGPSLTGVMVTLTVAVLHRPLVVVDAVGEAVGA